MANNMGLFSNMGIDTRTEEERLADAARQRAAMLIQNTQSLSQGYRTAGARQATQFGGMLGALIGQKVAPVELTKSQHDQALAVAAADARFKKYVADNPEVPIEDQALEKQKYLAEELLRSGDFENGMQLAQRYQDIKTKRLRSAAELNSLEASTNAASAATEARIFDTDTKKFLWQRGQLTTIWPKGESPVDPQGQTAFVQQDGSAKTADGQVIPLGKYSIIAPPKSLKGATANDLGIGDIEARDIRKQRVAVMAQMRAAISMKQALQEAIGKDGSLNIMGQAGGLTAGFAQLVDNLTTVGRSIDAALSVEGNSTNLATNKVAADAYASKHFEELDASLGGLVPPSLRKDKRAREKYYSALTQLTYARSIAAEPGARNVSDLDFSRHIIETGGASSDPESFRQIMLGNISRDVQGFHDVMSALPIGVPDLIVSKEGMKKFNDLYDNFSTEFGTDFGTGAQVGPGLAPEQNKVLQYNPETGQLE